MILKGSKKGVVILDAVAMTIHKLCPLLFFHEFRL
jgi:hypothetical protein